MGGSFCCSFSDPTVLVLPGGHYFSFTTQYTFALQKTTNSPIAPFALTFSLANTRPFMGGEAVYPYSPLTLPSKWRHWCLGQVPQLVLKSTPCPAQSKQLLRDAFLQLAGRDVSTATATL